MATLQSGQALPSEISVEQVTTGPGRDAAEGCCEGLLLQSVPSQHHSLCYCEGHSHPAL